MRVRRLSWAGAELHAGDTGLLVDPLGSLDPLLEMVRADPAPLVAPDAGAFDAALVTHLHRDHCDVEAIARALRPGGVVLTAPWPDASTETDLAAVGATAAELRASGLDVATLAPGDARGVGAFTVTATLAVDGTGDPQVSWVVTDGTHTVLHGGDTLWHGAFWRIGRAHGPIDVALLPVNGARINFPWAQPAVEAPASMTPEQAVAAARALGARALVPIHFGLIDHPDFYRAAPDAGAAAVALAPEAGLEAQLVAPGDDVAL